MISIILWCLNPYYTGIHLPFDNGQPTGNRQPCLNPYYTGIHLPPMTQKTVNSLKLVLILIILEYIYLLNAQKQAERDESLNPYYTGIHLPLTD